MRTSSPRYQDEAYFVVDGCCGLGDDAETNLGPINIRGMQWGLPPRPAIPYGAAAEAMAPGMLLPGFRITKTGDSIGWVIDNQQAWRNQRDLYESLLTQLEQDRMGGVVSWPDYVIKKNLYETWLSRLDGLGEVVQYKGPIPFSTTTKIAFATAAAIGLGSLLLLLRMRKKSR